MKVNERTTTRPRLPDLNDNMLNIPTALYHFFAPEENGGIVISDTAKRRGFVLKTLRADGDEEALSHIAWMKFKCETKRAAPHGPQVTYFVTHPADSFQTSEFRSNTGPERND